MLWFLGKALNSVLYDAWASCNEGCWSKSSFLTSVRERHLGKRKGMRKWLTSAEMDEKFGTELATQIRTRKLLDTELQAKEVRRHPELPDAEAYPALLFESCLKLCSTNHWLEYLSIGLNCTGYVLNLQEMVQFLTLVEDSHEDEYQEEIDRLYKCVDCDSSSSDSGVTEKSKDKKKKKAKKAYW